jgi:hypothetical protein
VEGEIDRDIERTFPANPFFSEEGATEQGQLVRWWLCLTLVMVFRLLGDGRRLLGNVLKAVAQHADDIGYCQVREVLVIGC